MNDDIIRLKEREREGKRDKENNKKKKGKYHSKESYIKSKQS